jgi:plasmid stability protein
MTTITIRNLDENVKRRLQVRAALNGRSMEAEVRASLAATVESGSVTAEMEEDLGTALFRRFAALEGTALPIPLRQFSARPLPNFD